MNIVESSVYDNSALIQVTLVVDCNKDVSVAIQQLKDAIKNTDNEFFRTRYAHWTRGGCVTVPERQEYRRLEDEAEGALSTDK